MFNFILQVTGIGKILKHFFKEDSCALQGCIYLTKNSKLVHIVNLKQLFSIWLSLKYNLFLW